MTLTKNQLIVIAVAAGVLAIALFFGGHSCAGGCRPVPPPPVVLGIDAGPGEDEIAGRLDAALAAGHARIEEIERKFDEDMAAFDEAQRAEYERLRGGEDLDAAARYLSEWNRRRRRE